MTYFKYKDKEFKDISDFPESCVGFIYKISNLSNGRFYIGKKQIESRRKTKLTLKEKLLPENKRKTYKIVTKDNKWCEYTGSCKELNSDIKNGDKYTKEILHFCFNKKQLSYFELKYQFLFNVLEDVNSYNGNIASKYFRKDLI